MRRLICLLLCLMLLPLPALAEEEASPTIRVLLRRLNLTDCAYLTLDGPYTVATKLGATMTFPKGSEVTVNIRGGELYLFYQGMSLQAGKEVRFIRNASEASGTEGIRFAKNGNFYPGDLKLTIENGALYPVMTLAVEDYLLGVVPYEMGDSFPLEALKAQAICARTYALSHVDPSDAYDVVDTTNDQVFKGVDLDSKLSIQAVQDTAGIVGMYKGKLANCYYSASNGGQTELVENVWSGRERGGYFAITDDPFDLENPASVVRCAKLNKNGQDIPADFNAVLSSYMADKLIKHGFEPLPKAFRIDEIKSVSLAGTKFDPPSRFVDEMTITFTWSGKKLLTWYDGQEDSDEEISLFSATPVPTETPEPTAQPEITPEPQPVYSDFIPVEEEATVTLPIFPEVIRALGLSISGSDNEMLTLVETDDAFTLEARRFGHGVGMSQRGAQWMAAAYGKQYHEILAFYYPGMELAKVAAGELPLPTTQPELAQTPPPRPRPRPGPP